jgi:hypothetical protein
MIEQVKNCLELNMNQINSYEFKEEQIDNETMFKKNFKETVLNKNCFYFKRRSLWIMDKKIGHLIVTDWYLTDNQLDFLKYSNF